MTGRRRGDHPTIPQPVQQGDRAAMERYFVSWLWRRIVPAYAIVLLSSLLCAWALGMSRWSLNVQLERTREKARTEATLPKCK